MPEYWIDTNVLIQAKNGPYPFDSKPEFWALLDRMNDEGLVVSSTLVRDELLKGTDELAEWARERRSTAMFVEPDEDTQRAFREVAQHVFERYERNQADLFLAVADPWLIAHAMASGGKVVTQETRRNPERVKIPNVCDAFGVESINSDDMLRELGASFS